MGNQVEPKLTEELLPLLQSERFVTIATVDHETGTPNVNAISWVFAPSQEKVRFAVDNRSRIIENINNHSGVTLNLIGNGSTYSIVGDASVIQEKMDDVPLKLALVEINIKEVRDVMFYGARIAVEPKYEKTYDANAAAKLDSQVMDSMKKA
ncbi:pyridoxamine 5'-phosphate oxidase family protein [Alkalihalobacterium chitinilyticum]|uniref:Pyridoxamine 5'-phosphate oxidase family protein n=1 Tax=Alkalihalobacterium chitinilyticum TaxID=2980103 RepID=A0ABT5VD79_9BACI|nr:pyridoxamine 5'-phosphate oxidase family protein [Alkalihalobacterium chitinilyticum]MDE5413116.1 pyridoxamine 5'-phosphate oxidase family protein [Alkalihalobacterium chitinilyticum]